MKKKVLGIIPARGGSKGVNKKNIREVGGKPLIYWSIKAASESKLLNSWIVSTDSNEIEVIASKFLANVVKRPDYLAGDKTPMIDVLQYVCEQFEQTHSKFDYICLLQPTAPMRSSICIDESISVMLNDTNLNSLVSVYKVDDCHPSRMYKIKNNKMIHIYEEPSGSLRQDLEDIFHRNGAIYICKRDLLMNKGKLICEEPYPFVMSKSDSINIDDEQDLLIADHLMNIRNNENINN